MTAVGRDNLAEVTRLLDEGADPNYEKRDNESIYTSPLKYARTTEIANLLIDRGANPNASGTLSVAVFGSPLEVVELLLRRGANPNKGYSRISFPLQEIFNATFIRAPHGRPKIEPEKIKLLCKYTDPNLSNKVIKAHPEHADLLKECISFSKAEIAERVSPAMAGLNRMATRQYGFDTDFPHIEQNIGEYAFRGRTDASGRRNTKKRKSYKKKTKKRKFSI
jgi:hypothetical protein